MRKIFIALIIFFSVPTKLKASPQVHPSDTAGAIQSQWLRNQRYYESSPYLLGPIRKPDLSPDYRNPEVYIDEEALPCCNESTGGVMQTPDGRTYIIGPR